MSRRKEGEKVGEHWMLCSVGVAMGGWLNLFRQSSKRKERTKRISDCGAESGWRKKDEGDTWNEKLFWYIFSHFISCVHIPPHIHTEKSSNSARISQKKTSTFSLHFHMKWNRSTCSRCEYCEASTADDDDDVNTFFYFILVSPKFLYHQNL